MQRSWHDEAKALIVRVIAHVVGMSDDQQLRIGILGETPRASSTRFRPASVRIASESKSNSRPESKVTWIPSPTRSTFAPGMLMASSFAC